MANKVEMRFRKYNPKRDREDILRIMQEIGWLERERKKDQLMNAYIQSCRALVAEVRGSAECLASTMPGTIRYLEDELSLCAVTCVVTSPVARKQGLASRLTAQVIALAAQRGAQVAGLGVFEQGFYNRLGFGTGPYEHWISFDPASLKLDKHCRIPYRIAPDKWKVVHESRLSRMKHHGSCNLLNPRETQMGIFFVKNGFGLGYFDGKKGELTHHLWISAKGEHGPYRICWMAYQNYDQFLELLSLLKSLGDQVLVVRMREPPGIQIQDLLVQPFKYRKLTRHSDFENNMRSSAYWQMRILDFKGCIQKTQLEGESVQFNLELYDPIDQYLDQKTGWRGIGGKYIVSLGSDSDLEQGKNSKLPTLSADVGAFTRLWLGARSATSLSVTDKLSGPEELVADLDRIFRVPEPKPDWDF